MVIALELDAVASEREFYDLTEGEMAFRFEAARRRHRSRNTLAMKAAWHAAAWASFTREIPPWEDVHAQLTGAAPKVATPQELENLITFMAKTLGGRIEKEPPAPPPAGEASGG